MIQDGTTEFSKVVGTGQFELGSITPRSQSVFTANKNYRQARKPCQHLDHQLRLPKRRPRLNALLAGDMDIVPTVPQALGKANAASGRIVLGDAAGPAFVAPTMIIDRPPFNDVRVRQAMRLLADREAMTLEAFDGYATPETTARGTSASLGIKPPPRQPIRSRRSRCSRPPAGEARADALTADIILEMNETATLYAQQAAAGGVDISIKVVDPAIYYGAASPGGDFLLKTFSIDDWTTETSSMAFSVFRRCKITLPTTESHLEERLGGQTALRCACGDRRRCRRAGNGRGSGAAIQRGRLHRDQ